MNKSIGLPPISPADLMALYEHLTEDDTECNGLDNTRDFLEERGLPMESILTWLKCNGGYCDSEVAMNVCDHWAIDWMWASKAKPALASVCAKSWDIEPMEQLRLESELKSPEVEDIFDEMTPKERGFICQFWGRSGMGLCAAYLLALVERRTILKERGDLQEYEVRKSGTAIWLDSLIRGLETEAEEEEADAEE
jgi:hypothetical protein